MANYQETIICIILIIIIVWLLRKRICDYVSPREGFQNTSNFVMTNKNGIANAMEFGEVSPGQLLTAPLPNTSPSSNNDGYSMNSNTDTYTKDGYKWTKEDTNDFDINTEQNKLSNEQLRNEFQNMYMLDPSGDLAKYDISNMPVSKYCCPAVYRNPSGGEDDMDPEKACEYANKYVANSYSGMNFKDGLGCVCMTPQDASFFSARGGNTTIA